MDDTEGKLKIIVLGSIGYGGIDYIRRMYDMLEREGYDVIKHIFENGTDYTDITDIRHERDLSRRICEHDLEYVSKADILVILGGKPSWGTAMEEYKGKAVDGKTTILLAKDPLPTPRPINYADYVVDSEEKLTELLRNIKVDKND